MFITTKIWKSNWGYDKARASIRWGAPVARAWGGADGLGWAGLGFWTSERFILSTRPSAKAKQQRGCPLPPQAEPGRAGDDVRGSAAAARARRSRHACRHLARAGGRDERGGAGASESMRSRQEREPQLRAVLRAGWVPLSAAPCSSPRSLRLPCPTLTGPGEEHRGVKLRRGAPQKAGRDGDDQARGQPD